MSPTYDNVVEIDIDGTITKQLKDDWGSDQILPGVKEKIDEFRANGYYILIRTGRSWDGYNQTRDMLDNAGIVYDELQMGKPICARNYLIIDDKNVKAVVVPRNKGISHVQVA